MGIKTNKKVIYIIITAGALFMIFLYRNTEPESTQITKPSLKQTSEPSQEIITSNNSWPDISSCKDGSYSSVSTKVGAIRWDVWVGSSNSTGRAVEKSLSPNQFHFRLPFFGVETSTNSVEAECTTQKCMDQEIIYAKYAGLDYWAFLWYPIDSGLQQSLNLYLKSGSRNNINFALIMQLNSWSNIPSDKLETYFGMKNYQIVLDDRPLFFILPGTEPLTKIKLEEIKIAANSAGRNEPYFVYFIQNSNFHLVQELGIDAVSMYAFTDASNGQSFSSLTGKEVESWNWIHREGLQLIPHVSTGWDPRPRFINPVPWTTYDPNNWAQTATPEEISSHVKNAIDWVKNNKQGAKADTIIIYAWNEFDEGGWIAPTLSKYGGAERIDSLSALLANCD